MDALKELVQHLDKWSLGSKPNKGEGKLDSLFNLMKSGKHSDAEIEHIIYGKKTDVSFFKLKSDLKNHLLGMLLIKEPKITKNSQYRSTMLRGFRNVALCRILAAVGARRTALELAKKTYDLASKHHLNDIGLQAARILREYYAKTGKVKDFHSMNQAIDRFMHFMAGELEAEKAYQTIALEAMYLRKPKDEASKLALDYAGRLKELAKDNPSFWVNFNFYRLHAWGFHFNNHFRKALEVYDQMEAWLNENPIYKRSIVYGHLHYNRLLCYLHLEDWKAGKKMADNCLSLYRPGQWNWFVFQEGYFLLLMRGGKFFEALEVYQTVRGHNKFALLDDLKKELWLIFEAYLYFVLKTIPNSKKRLTAKRFKLEKFLNEVPQISKDKRGYNISILVIHILFLLQTKDFQKIIDRMDALQKYIHRYLKREEDIRSKLFIKMLMVMERQSFDHNKTIEKAQKYLAEMQTHQFQYEGTPIDAEIIPYETLWEMVLKILKEQSNN